MAGSYLILTCRGLYKMAKRDITTVGDMLTRDCVKKLLADLDKIKPGLRGLLVIPVERDGSFQWRAVGLEPNEMVDYLSQVKDEIELGLYSDTEV